MSEFISSSLGTAFFAVVIFVAGALIGQPLWGWFSKKLPWSK